MSFINEVKTGLSADLSLFGKSLALRVLGWLGISFWLLIALIILVNRLAVSFNGHNPDLELAQYGLVGLWLFTRLEEHIRMRMKRK